MDHPLIHGLSSWDYAVIVFYFLFVVSIGFICRRLSSNASDYFRGGGNMLWWVVWISSMASGISTWTFTGGAAKCYQDGFLLPVSYWIAILPAAMVGLAVAPWLKRFRVITAMEAVYRRFGMGTEQFYTWITLPMGIFIGGVGLNTLGVFMASAFQADLPTTILVVGVIMTFLATLGGQWGVAMGAFVQGLVMFLIVFVVIYFSVNLPEIGGPTHLLSALPARHLQFNKGAETSLVAVWLLWQLFGAIYGGLDIRNAGKVVRLKDESNARKAILWSLVPSMIFGLPLLMQIPAMCAAVVFPDLHPIFPNLKNPEEAAWVAMSFKVLPQGLLGLLVCGMFSAAVDNLDAALNTNAGFFVRNVFTRYIHPTASDKLQLIVGKVVTVLFGCLMIAVGLTINSMRTTNLFEFFQLFNAIVLTPMAIPMVLGMVVRKTPAWAGWSTVLVGLCVASIVNHIYSPELIQHLMHYSHPLTDREIRDSQFLFVSILNCAGCATWFMFTTLFYRFSTVEHKERVQLLFADINRPIDRAAEGSVDQDAMQYKIIGQLCLIFGGFMLLCMLIPNPLRGRMAFLFIGGVLTLLGSLLTTIYLRKTRKPAEGAAPASNALDPNPLLAGSAAEGSGAGSNSIFPSSNASTRCTPSNPKSDPASASPSPS